MNVEKLKGTEIDKIESLEILCLSGRPVTEDKDVDTVRVLGEKQLCLSPYLCLGSEVTEIRALWNALPYSDQNRCHIPKFALRITTNNEIQLVATICWECNNIHLSGSRVVERLRQFDGSSEVGQQLLNFCSNKFV
ncbi:MAG: hypothetical protein ACKVH8_04230 [Pirellulales bacterium]